MGAGASPFQSTLPRGERRARRTNVYICKRFQSTLPRGERPSCLSSVRGTSRFQSTLPRGERRTTASPSAEALIFQSTLPRGERLVDLIGTLWPIRISIHAPARGATVVPNSSVKIGNNFNPRSREGSDTAGELRKYKYREDFNPRSREGSDVLDSLHALGCHRFQSTLPRGERPF